MTKQNNEYRSWLLNTILIFLFGKMADFRTGEEKYRMSLEPLVVPENEDMLKD